MSQPLPIWGPHAAKSLKLDCRHYLGDRPCGAGVQGVCPSECSAYQKMGHRIVIIKLGALGDVIRTAAILPGIKKRWPTSHITWISKPSGVHMLANHPQIDRLLPFDAETLCHIEHERFDLCLSLDKEAGPTALAMRIDARDRRGIGLSPYGTTFPLNPECSDYFRLGLDDELKFHKNKQSYQELLYTAIGLPYAGERYELFPSQSDRNAARHFWESNGLDNNHRIIGINTGAGRVFANKAWSPEQYQAAIQRLQKQNADIAIALFGGPDERQRNEWLSDTCPGVINTGTHHSELGFAALIERCTVLLTGDTMAMHVAIAAQIPTVVLFGPTCHQEIDLFGRGEKLTSQLSCSPCYARNCDISPSCMDEHGIDQVVNALLNWASAERAKPLPVLQEQSA